VRTSVVSAHFDSAGVGKLIAYLVAEPGHEVSRAGIREHLSARLPAYLVPSSCVFLDALPLTPNGKVDRRALPAPGAGAGEPVPPPNRYLAPRDGLEATLVGLWREVLEVDRVGMHDDFFELGGHSLSATRLVALLERATSARVRLRDLFHAPTPAALAVILRARLEAGAAALVAASDALNLPPRPIAPATPKELEMLDE
jgi:acyl carrier protein